MATKVRLTPTDRAIIAQLKENTGIAICDSGGQYGRHWQQNQGRKFLDEPESTLDFRYGIEVTHNVFHWLRERLEYDSDMTRKLKSFARRKKYEYDNWLTIMEDFCEAHGGESEGAYNTYNGEDLVSQTLQFCTWYSAEDCAEYVALQVHGGADVRGGYSAPKVYRTVEGLYDNSRAGIHCPVCRAHWESDEGYYWRPDDVQIDLSFLDGHDTHPALPLDTAEREPWPLLNIDEKDYCGKKQDAYTRVELDTEEFPAERKRGNLYINSEGKGLCPYCLTGILFAGYW